MEGETLSEPYDEYLDARAERENLALSECRYCHETGCDVELADGSTWHESCLDMIQSSFDKRWGCE